jgi:hypothetical protein
MGHYVDVQQGRGRPWKQYVLYIHTRTGRKSHLADVKSIRCARGQWLVVELTNAWAIRDCRPGFS